MTMARRRENRKKSHYKSWLAKLLSKYAYKARKRGIAFELTREQFEALIFLNCYMCGAKPSNKLGLHDKNGTRLASFSYNGIDRIDNAKGYVVGNVQPCCKVCNQIKSDRTSEDLENHILKIIKHNLNLGDK